MLRDSEIVIVGDLYEIIIMTLSNNNMLPQSYALDRKTANINVKKNLAV